MTTVNGCNGITKNGIDKNIMNEEIIGVFAEPDEK